MKKPVSKKKHIRSSAEDKAKRISKKTQRGNRK